MVFGCSSKARSRGRSISDVPRPAARSARAEAGHDPMGRPRLPSLQLPGRGKAVAALPPDGHEPTGVRLAHQRPLACARDRRVALGLECADLAIHLRRLRDVRTRLRAGDRHGRRGREADAESSDGLANARPGRTANGIRGRDAVRQDRGDGLVLAGVGRLIVQLRVT